MARVISTPTGGDGAGFAGFGPRALDFLKALAFHQEKTWYEANKAIYESDIRAPFETLLGLLTAEYGRRGLPLRGDARSIFRLHRDIRFAKDKRPYKTNAGAVLTRDGTKKSTGLVYLHLDPDGCFLAGGFWQPSPAELTALRHAIVRRPAGFREAVSTLAKRGLAFGDGDALAKPPRGFDGVTEPDLAQALRLRNLVVRRPLTDEAIRSPRLADDILGFTEEVEPLLRFGWTAIDR